MSDIFVPDPADAERPVDYVANPLRVQLPGQTGMTGDRRKFARLDLIALANSIVARETDSAQLREIVTSLRADLIRLNDRLERIERGPGQGKLARMLKALADIEDEYAEDGTPDDSIPWDGR